MDAKKNGLELGEAVAGMAWEQYLKPMIIDAIEKSPNKYDDMALAFMGQIDDLVKGAIDKIDGEVG